MNIKNKIQTNSAYILIIILVEFVVLNLLIFKPVTIGMLIYDAFDSLGLYMNLTATSTVEDIQKISTNNLMLVEIGWIMIRIYELIVVVLFSLTGYLCNKLLPLPEKIKYRYLPLLSPFFYWFLSLIVYVFTGGSIISMILEFFITATLLTIIGYLLAKNIPFQKNIYKKYFPFIVPFIYTLILYLRMNIYSDKSIYIMILPIFYGRDDSVFSSDDSGLILYPIIFYAAFAISFIVFDRFRIRREKKQTPINIIEQVSD